MSNITDIDILRLTSLSRSEFNDILKLCDITLSQNYHYYHMKTTVYEMEYYQIAKMIQFMSPMDKQAVLNNVFNRPNAKEEVMQLLA